MSMTVAPAGETLIASLRRQGVEVTLGYFDKLRVGPRDLLERRRPLAATVGQHLGAIEAALRAQANPADARRLVLAALPTSEKHSLPDLMWSTGLPHALVRATLLGLAAEGLAERLPAPVGGTGLWRAAGGGA